MKDIKCFPKFKCILTSIFPERRYMKNGIRVIPFSYFSFSASHYMYCFLFTPFYCMFSLGALLKFLISFYASLRFSLALLHQLLLVLMQLFLQDLLTWWARWKFVLELCFVGKLCHLNFLQKKLWKMCFPVISWKLPHKDACCTLYSPEKLESCCLWTSWCSTVGLMVYNHYRLAKSRWVSTTGQALDSTKSRLQARQCDDTLLQFKNVHIIWSLKT